MIRYIAVQALQRLLRKYGITNDELTTSVWERSRTDLCPVVTCEECRYGAEVPQRNAKHEDMTESEMHVLEVKYGETRNDWSRTLVYACQLTGLRRGRGFYCFDGEKRTEDSGPDG